MTGAFQKIDRLFTLLLLLLVLANIPYWDNAVWPHHDTTYVFQMFYYFYNTFSQHGELAMWTPYGAYGLPLTLWQFTSFTPANHFTAIIGLLFRVTNVLLLFKLSVLLEQFMLLLGMYLLSQKMFRHKSAVFLVSLGAVYSSVWFLQIFWNFRIMYLLPLVFYFMLRFFEEKRPHNLWTAGLVSTFALAGSPPYYGALHLLILTVFSAVLSTRYALAWTSLLERSWKNLLGFLLFAAVVFLFLYLTVHMLDHTQSYHGDRDPVTHVTPIYSFMVTPPAIGMNKFLGLFFAGLHDDKNIALNYTMYIGILPLIFIGYALVRTRTVLFAAIGSIVLTLGCFSLADTSFVARLTYDLFPGIKYFNYIGIMGAPLRIFFLLLAGMGWDTWRNERELFEKNRTGADPHKRLLGVACGVLGLMLFLDRINASGTVYPKPWLFLLYISLGLNTAAFLFIGYTKSLSTHKKSALLVAIFLIEMFLYQYYVVAGWEYRWPWAEKAARNIYPMEYQSERLMRPDVNERTKAAHQVVDTNIDRLVIEGYSFMLFDPCIPPYHRPQHITNGVDRLFKLRGRFIIERTRPPEAEPFLRALGCGEPKLRLYSDVYIARDEKDAEEYVETHPAIDEKPALHHVPNEWRASWRSYAPPEKLGDIRVTRFTANRLELEANVTDSRGAWLYYADAWHPDWRVDVNGKDTPIVVANLGFKTVKLNAGKSIVHWHFSNRTTGISLVLITVLGLCFVLYTFAITPIRVKH